MEVLPTPGELHVREALHALGHMMLVVDVVVRDDGHLQVRQRAVGRAADAAAELVLGDLAGSVELLAVHDLGHLVVVIGDGVHHVALDLAGVGHGREEAGLGHQVGTAALAAAGNGQVAGHGLQEHGHGGGVVAQVALGHAVHLLQVDGLHGRVVAGEGPDGLGRDARDRLGPFRSVSNAVHLADDVLAPLLEAIGLHPLRHVLVVVEVLGVEHVGHRQAERRVGSGADGYPLGAQGLGAHVVHRVDQDELAAALLGQLHVVGHMSEPGHHGIEAPQHHELGVQQIGSLEAGECVGRSLDEAVGEAHAQMEVLSGSAAGGRVVAPAGDGARHVGGEREVGALERHVVAVVQPGMVGVLLGHLLHLARDGVERLVPGDALETTLAGAFPAHALHGVQQAVLRVELLAPRMAHGASASLEHAGLDGVLVVVLAGDARVHRVVGLDGDDFVILNAALDQAGGIPTAVVVAGGVEVIDPLVTLA